VRPEDEQVRRRTRAWLTGDPAGEVVSASIQHPRRQQCVPLAAGTAEDRPWTL